MFMIECFFFFFFCPDGIIPDSGLTGLNNTYIYIQIRSEEVLSVFFFFRVF